jgi:hypothetical protein
VQANLNTADMTELDLRAQSSTCPRIVRVGL